MRLRSARPIWFALVVLTIALLPAGGARAQTTLDIQVGAPFFQGGGPPGEGIAFYPARAKVHKGDTLHFASPSFHTVTALPTGQNPVDWREAHGSSPNGEWGVITLDPDDGAGAIKINNRAAFPSDPTCGAPGQPACSFNGSGDAVNGVLNSGLPFGGPLDFSIEMQANPGESIWLLCLIHPEMQMRVDVVAQADQASTQTELNTVADSQQANDLKTARALDAKLSKPTFHRNAAGEKIWDSFVGFDSGRVSLFAMYPKRLEVRQGQRVQFNFQLTNEIHTATFPGGEGIRMANEFGVPACDPDGDGGTAPDNPPEIEGPPFCNDPSQLELDVTTDLINSSGNGRVTSHSDFENSAIRGEGFVDPYTLRFPRADDKAYTYRCGVHPFMVGRVFVL